MFSWIKRNINVREHKDLQSDKYECFGTIYPGTRVVRGPDWENKFQDNGEGFLGTIVSTSNETNKDITVIWDSGRKFSYRASKNLFDLRVFNTAESGVIHNLSCNFCDEKSIKGILWKCAECPQANMCSICYMSDKHNIDHAFYRLVEPYGKFVEVPPRGTATDTRITSKGIFRGAEVTRGPDWCYDDEDCKDVGYVTLNGPRDMSLFKVGVVSVLWKATEKKRIHRLGINGCVDIVFSRNTETAHGWSFYPEHLPVLNLDVFRFEQVHVTELSKIWKFIADANKNKYFHDRCEIVAISALALHDCSAERDDELSFSKGDILFVLDITDTQWWKATTSPYECNETNQGLVPSNYLFFNCNLPTVTKALHDYTACIDGGITVRKGERFLLVDRSDEDWWLVRRIHIVLNKIMEGYVPRSYMTIDISEPLPHLIALRDYLNTDKNQLSFKKGDILFYLDKIEDYGWYVCNGNPIGNKKIKVGYIRNEYLKFPNEMRDDTYYEYIDAPEADPEVCFGSFKVEIVPTDDSIRLGLHGTCCLQVTLSSIELSYFSKDNSTLRKLKLNHNTIRKYGLTSDGKEFVLLSGRRCESGVGKFIFRCENASLIYNNCINITHVLLRSTYQN